VGFTVLGQPRALRILTSAHAGGRVAHAYLFAGPEHTGKTLTALQFAQLLNCTGEQPPCGRCRQCEQIASGAHADVEIIGVGGLCDQEGHDHRKDDSKGIRICQIRRLERVVSRAPYEGRYRVLIIEPADALNREAEVALLKTLEEPPPHVVIILITAAEDALLDTIRSRARRVPFGGMSRGEIELALRNRWDVDPSRAAALARMSEGRFGWAVIALHDESLLERREATLAQIERLAQAPLAERFAFAAEVGGRYTRDRAAVHEMLALWRTWWRDILLIASGRHQLALHHDRLDRLRPLAARCEVTGAARALRAIGETGEQLRENASPILALEALMLALPVLRVNPVAERIRG